MPLTVLEGHVACFIRERHAADRRPVPPKPREGEVE
jgi:hypothetical protein